MVFERTGLALLFLMLLSGFQKKDTIRYLGARTLSLPPDTVVAYPVDFKDTTAQEILYQTLSKEGWPLSYHRSIQASVCFDGKCRLLDIVLYWNTTGRYLGFELPEGEFLSKSDHEPFLTFEYAHLHRLLADSLSPLADYRFDEIVPGTANEEVDAVSSATIKEVLDYIVPGAAYTTYRLWHLVYGATKHKITEMTAAVLSPELAVALLQSPDISDQIWVLDNFNSRGFWSEELINAVFRCMESDNYNLAARAVSVADAGFLRSQEVQLRWVKTFANVEYGLKKLMINTLARSPGLSGPAAIALSKTLTSLNGDLIGSILDLYAGYNISDTTVLTSVSALLDNPNTFIAGKAFGFLKAIDSPDLVIRGKMDAYRLNNR